jgi:hypothetical protein
MAKFVQIGNEIINLDQVVRIERAVSSGTQTVVMVYFSDNDERTVSRFTDEQAESVWQRFAGQSEPWDAPEPRHDAPAGPGLVSRVP